MSTVSSKGGLPPDVEALLAQAIAEGWAEDVTPDAGSNEYTQILGYPRPVVDQGRPPKNK